MKIVRLVGRSRCRVLCASRRATLAIRRRAGTPRRRGEGAGTQELERITARRSELDTLAEELAKRLQQVQAEREEL